MFKQLVSVESAPVTLRRLCEFEDHREASVATSIAFGTTMAKADGRERRLDRVGRPKMTPVLCGEIVEREQFVTILLEATDGFRVLRIEVLYE